MQTFRFAVNTHGKDKEWDFNNLATKFTDKQGSIETVKKHVKSGHALCAGLLNGKRRKKANVIGSQWILIDIDNECKILDENGKPINGVDGKALKQYKQDLTLDDALKHPFIRNYCALIYTTASHGKIEPNAPNGTWDKFRLVFILPEFISDVGHYEATVRLLMERLPHDPACKDASRVFYGSTKTTFPLVNPDAVLPAEWLERGLVAANEAKAKAEQAEQERRRRTEERASRVAEAQRQGISIEGDWDESQWARHYLDYIDPNQLDWDGWRACILASHGFVSEPEIRQWSARSGIHNDKGFDEVYKSIGSNISPRLGVLGARAKGQGWTYEDARQAGHKPITQESYEEALEQRLLVCTSEQELLEALSHELDKVPINNSSEIGTLIRTAYSVAKAVRDRQKITINLKKWVAKAYRKRDKAKYYQDWGKQLKIRIPSEEIEARKAINKALEKTQLLSGDVYIGSYDKPEIPDDGRLLDLYDGQKCTRKTSQVLTAYAEYAKRYSKRMLVLAETRILAAALAKQLGIPAILPDSDGKGNDKWRYSHQVVCCPESAHKVRDWDLEIFMADEANVDIERAFAGNLGQMPKKSREAIRRAIEGSRICVLANDVLYRSVVQACQRIGKFAPNEVRVNRRKRNPTEITVYVYSDDASEFSSETYDGIESDKIPGNVAFGQWLSDLFDYLRQGFKICIPCGSQNKAREIQKLIKHEFGGKKKIKCIDGPYSRSKAKTDFAKNPDGIIQAESIDVLIYTPVFNGGLSIESEYFDYQFEYVSVQEPATSASQRGERVRDVIFVKKIKSRHVYVTNRGLSNTPDIEVFFPDYWKDFLLHGVNSDFNRGVGLAKQLGCTSAIKASQNASIEDWANYAELADIYAIKARETFFKREILEDEWISNGWAVEQAGINTVDAKHWLAKYALVKEEVIRQKSRTEAKAKAKRLDGEEPQGPIERVKAGKWELGEKIGHDWGKSEGIFDPNFLAAWKYDPGKSGGLEALRIRALLAIGSSHPETFAAICNSLAIRALSKVLLPEEDPIVLPVSPWEFDVAELLLNSPSITKILNGEVETWTKESPFVVATAEYARAHSRRLAELSSHKNRIHGLQFTEKTPDIKCFHKLLLLAGYEAKEDGREATGRRLRKYRLKTSEDVQKVIEERSLQEYQDVAEIVRGCYLEMPSYNGSSKHREKYRLETQNSVFGRIKTHIEARIEKAQQEWLTRTSDLRAKTSGDYNPSTTSAYKTVYKAEVLDGDNKYKAENIDEAIRLTGLTYPSGQLHAKGLDSDKDYYVMIEDLRQWHEPEEVIGADVAYRCPYFDKPVRIDDWVPLEDGRVGYTTIDGLGCGLVHPNDLEPWHLLDVQELDELHTVTHRDAEESKSEAQSNLSTRGGEPPLSRTGIDLTKATVVSF